MLAYVWVVVCGSPFGQPAHPTPRLHCSLVIVTPHPASVPPPPPLSVQGLAEVLSVMGEAHLSELLPELLASATSKNPFVREGHLTLFR